MWASNSNNSFSIGSQQGFTKPQDSSPNTSFTQTDKQRKFRSQTVVPVTIGHIHETMKLSDAFKMGDMEVNMVSVVGLVESVEQKTTHIVYLVNDMTGPPISIQHWIDDSSDEMLSDKRPMVEHTYIQVYGSVKKMRDQLNVIVFKIKPITDLNDLTIHLLEVMHSRKMLEAKQKRKLECGIEGTEIHPQTGNTSAMEIDTETEGIPEGLSKIQAMAYKTVMGCQAASGCSVDWLREQLPSFNSASLGQALSFLCDEGHVYTTIDDSHFKVT